jgi:predicted DNA binding CopG/RHH family protein
MRNEYNFSKSKPNPYARKLKQPVTIRLDESTVRYFKQLAKELDMPYQSLINLYLRDCAASRRSLSLKWRPKSGHAA